MSPQQKNNHTDDVPTNTGSDGVNAALTYPERGGIDVFDSLLVRQPIAEGQTQTVRDLLADWAAENGDGDARTLLPVDGVTLVTLFLDDGEFGWTDNAGRASHRGDALLWYIEVVDDDADAWKSPDTTIRRVSPLFEGELASSLTNETTVHAADRSGHRYITHVTNPNRTSRYADAVGRSLVAPAAGEELPIPVAITSLAVKAGLASTLVARAVDFVNWLKRFDRVQSWARDETETVEAEAVYTESLLLEAVGNRQVVHYYMETEDMDRLYEAFYESDDWEARFSEWVMRRVLANPETLFEPPLETDCEVLIHAVDPERP
jgi:hypothetical protein